MPAGKAEEAHISDICKPTTTKIDGKKADDMIYIRVILRTVFFRKGRQGTAQADGFYRLTSEPLLQ